MTETREYFLERAKEVALERNANLDSVLEEVKIHGKKVEARGSNERNTSLVEPDTMYEDPTPIDKRTARRSGNRVTLPEKIAIIYQAVCLKHLHADIAREHRISRQYVTYLQ